VKEITKTYVMARYGERRKEDRRLGSDRIVVTPVQEEVASIYEHALELYRRGDFEAAEIGFEHVLTLNPADGPSRLMKNRIAKYKNAYAGAGASFDPVYRFDDK